MVVPCPGDLRDRTIKPTCRRAAARRISTTKAARAHGRTVQGQAAGLDRATADPAADSEWPRTLRHLVRGERQEARRAAVARRSAIRKSDAGDAIEARMLFRALVPIIGRRRDIVAASRMVARLVALTRTRPRCDLQQPRRWALLKRILLLDIVDPSRARVSAASMVNAACKCKETNERLDNPARTRVEPQGTGTIKFESNCSCVPVTQIP
jgi:hypothetical protein